MGLRASPSDHGGLKRDALFSSIPSQDARAPRICQEHPSCTGCQQRDTHLLRPKKGATEPMMPILTAMRPTSRDSTMFHSCSSRLTSMLAPVVTKNSPSSIPRKGLMSASTCTRHSYSQTAMHQLGN